MRRLSFAALVTLLAACSSGLPEAPRSLTLNYDGRGELALRVPEGTIWRIQGPSELRVEPAEGVGPAVLALEAPIERAPNLPGERFTLAWQGDLQGTLTVRWPLVRVEGRVVEPPAVPAGLTLPARPLPEPAPAPAPTRVLVRYRSAAAAPMDAKAAGTPTLRALETSDVAGLLARLQSDPNVLWAEPDGYVQALGEPADEYYPLEWHLRRTGARWAFLGHYPRSVTVAVIDTGVRFDHPDLSGRLWGPADGAFDFVEDDDDPTDTGDQRHADAGSHGTHVTGIITARTGVNPLPPSCYDADGNPICSETGLAGLAWPADVRVLPLRVLDETGNGTFSAVAAAIRYAAGLPLTWGGQALSNPHPAQVINLSLGATLYSNALCEAVADAAAAGVLVVAAAGNSGGEAYYYPASCAGAVAVAAVDNASGEPKPTWYSQHNDRVTLSAPGGDVQQDADGDGYPDGVLSTTWNYETNRPNYAFYMGTSQASPQVAAALALLLAQDPSRTPADALNALTASATDLGEPGRDPYYGYGILNLPQALALELPPGPYRVRFRGPLERWVRADAEGRFALYLPSGDYRALACRDDSDNGFCDRGEPETREALRVPPQPLYETPTLTLP
ncbi:MAG TPA: peptidase S8 [Oceanithermus profundus]|uniref:Peptidase S8 n=1 Tax=Oceanithermus profundus TaxID=187137 RepID=A0A7C4V554_9DEIN|nr:peptidase S8 [Oceanithermus profundus]